jgi:hypothetical protein
LQLALLDDLVPLVAAELGIAFNLDDPATRAYLRSCGANIQGITDTTRAQVQAALAEGQAEGLGIPQLAARLGALPTFGPARATLVARTELGLSSWEGSLSACAAPAAPQLHRRARTADIGRRPDAVGLTWRGGPTWPCSYPTSNGTRGAATWRRCCSARPG